jgi:hypothetical protein
MGCWSEPIFVNPSNLTCDKSNIDPRLLDIYFRHCQHDIDKNNNSVDYTHQKLSDCSKIYGYLDDDELDFWKSYLHEISSQNNNITNIEFHLFCSDYDIPYIIGLFDGKFSVMTTKPDNPRWTRVENSNQILSDDENVSDCTDFITQFSKEKYIDYFTGQGRSHMKKIKYHFEDMALN